MHASHHPIHRATPGTTAPKRPRAIAAAVTLALVLGILLPGCDSGRPSTVVVSGTVTYRGAPVEHAKVMFIPKGTRPASGQTDASGHFELMSFAPGDGGVVGEHTVVIAKFKLAPGADPDSPYPETVSVLPNRYGSPLTSPLRANVTADGDNDFRFELAD